MLRNYTAENVGFLYFFAQLRVAHPLKHIACHDAARVLHPDFAGNGGGRHAVIAGDHDHAHARFAAKGDIARHGFPRRVRQAYKAAQAQPAIGQLFGNIPHDRHPRNRNHAQAVASHAL